MVTLPDAALHIQQLLWSRQIEEPHNRVQSEAAVRPAATTRLQQYVSDQSSSLRESRDISTTPRSVTVNRSQSLAGSKPKRKPSGSATESSVEHRSGMVAPDLLDKPRLAEHNRSVWYAASMSSKQMKKSLEQQGAAEEGKGLESAIRRQLGLK